MISLLRQPIRWNFGLVLFLRFMAVLWIIKGLLAWAHILGVWETEVPFDAKSTASQTALIYFAILDLVAAIGMWLTSTWGGVMWLLAVMSHIILSILMPAVLVTSALTLSLFVALIGAYLMVSWFAMREEH